MILKGLTAMLLAAGAAPVHVPVDVPMEMSGENILIRLSVNGSDPVAFVLSARSGPVELPRSLLTAFGLEEPATGSPLVLESVAIGDMILEDVAARPMAADRPSLESAFRGSIPLSLFEGYLVNIDYRNRRLTVSEGALPPEDGDTIVSLKVDPVGEIAVSAQIDGLRVPTRLLLGTSRNLVMNPEYFERLPLLSDPQVAGHRDTPQGKIEMRRARFGGPVRVGRQDLSVWTILFDSEEPEASLGYAALRDYVVTVDLSSRRLRLLEVAGP